MFALREIHDLFVSYIAFNLSVSIWISTELRCECLKSVPGDSACTPLAMKSHVKGNQAEFQKEGMV